MSTSWIDFPTLAVSFIAAGASVWAAIKTASAAKAAMSSADTSAKQLKTQILNQEKVERPRLVPLNMYINTNTHRVLSDWSTDEDNNSFIPFRTFYSNAKVPVLNAGKSFAIDIAYSFSLIGGTSAVLNYTSEYINVIFEPVYARQNDSRKARNNDFTFTIQELTESNILERFRARSYTEYISLIKSGETSEMYIPNYFVALCNFYSKHYLDLPKEYPRPQLRLVIEYKDQYEKRHVDEYVMELSSKPFEEGEYAHILDTRIDFTLAGTKAVDEENGE